MGGDPNRPKVMFPVADRPMVWWVVRACVNAGCERVVVVVGVGADQVRQALGDFKQCVFVEQTERLGTGHATRMAEPVFAGDPGRDVFVLAGDGPLIQAQTLRLLLDTHRRTAAAATLATSVLDNPSGYGRVVRDASGGYATIVEEKDATPEQRAIREVNPSYYCFRSGDLFAGLARVQPNNRQGEYYLTDVPALLKQDGKTVSVVEAVPPQDVLSINTPEQLAEVDRIMRARLSQPDRARVG